MDSRRIVKSGNTSYTISLPISWVRHHNLDAGDILNTWENSESDLLISPATRKEAAEKNATETIKFEKVNLPLAQTRLLQAYLRNFLTIHLRGVSSKSARQSLTAQTQEYLGLEVLEETTDEITFKNFFKLDQETSPRNLLRRIDVGLRVSLKLLSKESFDQEDERELHDFLDQNRRLSLLFRKNFLLLIEDPGLLKESRTTVLQLAREKTILELLLQASEALSLIGRLLPFLEGTESDLLHEHLKVVKKRFYETMSLTANPDPRAATELLAFFDDQDRALERLLASIDEPLLIQAIDALRWLGVPLRAIVEETLL